MRTAECSPDPTRRHTAFPPPLRKTTPKQRERLESMMAEVRAPAPKLSPQPTPEAFADYVGGISHAMARSKVRVREVKWPARKRRHEANTLTDFVAVIVRVTDEARDIRRATGVVLRYPHIELHDFAEALAHECGVRVVIHEGVSPKHPAASRIDGDTLRIVRYGYGVRGYIPLLRCTTRIVMRACGLPQRGAAATAFTKLLLQASRPVAYGFPNYEEACHV